VRDGCDLDEAKGSLISARGTFLIIATAVAFISTSGSAQVPTPAATPPYAVIEGVAIDSLHRDFLRGGVVIVDGVSKPAFTDSVGRFRIDSVPPGTRRVRVMHAVLDTIGIGLQTPELELVAGQQLHLVLSVPSIETVVAARCTEGERRIGPAALLGMVQFAESQSPAVGAQVVLEFIEVRVEGKRLVSVPFRRTATVAASGRFKLCGLPEDLSGSLMAINGADSTTSLGVRLSSRVGIIGLELPEPLASAASSPGASLRAGNAILTGRVLDPNGAGMPGARAAVSGDSAFALTDAQGRFALRNLRSGTRALSVRRLGFEPAEVAVSLHARSATDVTVRLQKFVVVLDTVRIVALEERGLNRVGFSRRKETGAGYYLTPEQIARQRAYDLPSLVAMAPMLRRDYSGGKPHVTGRPSGTGNGCVTWWLDGDTWIGGDIEDFIRPNEVAAVEVYSANFVPAQFRRPFQNCETIIIWTKQKVH